MIIKGSANLNYDYYEEECFDDYADELAEYDERYEKVAARQSKRSRREYFSEYCDYINDNGDYRYSEDNY